MTILHYDYCAIIICLVIMFSMITRKVVKGLTNNLFFQVLVFTILTTLADIFSEFHGLSPEFRCILDYVYFTGTVIVPLLYTLYIYSSVGLMPYFVAHKDLWLLLGIPLLIYSGVVVANIFTDCAFFIDQAGNYQRGPLQPVLAATSAVYVFAGVCTVFRWHKIMPKDKLFALSTFFPIITLGLVLQQLFQGLELNLFACSISELIIAFTTQRHYENYDMILGVRNYESALERFRKIYQTKQNASLIFIKVINQQELRHFMGLLTFNEFFKKLGKLFIECCEGHKFNTELYYINDGVFCLTVEGNTQNLTEKFAGNIKEKLAENFKMKGVSFSVLSSICIVRVPEDLKTLEDLMNFSMNFHAKLPESRDIHKLSSYLEVKDFKIKNDIDQILQRALQEHHFEMYFQPIYSVWQRKFISCEALIRLKDPEFGFISPALFIPAAEASGAIHQIGDFVIEDVCRFINQHKIQDLGLEYVELNLSVNQCIEADIVEKIEKICSKNNVLPKQVNLEITETAEGFNPDVMDKNVNQLHSQGYSFSLDDYGTGYSNIRRLTELPLDIVKIDKSFVDAMDDPQMWSVIVNTVKMFKEMHKVILVEGIEDQYKLEKFIALGIDYVQGYCFSKPLPEEEFVEFLKQNNF